MQFFVNTLRATKAQALFVVLVNIADPWVFPQQVRFHQRHTGLCRTGKTTVAEQVPRWGAA